MKPNNLYLKVKEKTEGLLYDTEIDCIIKSLNNDYNVIFLRDLKKFKKKLTLKKEKEDTFKSLRIIQEGKVIIRVDENLIQFGIEEPYKEPQIYLKDLMAVSIKTKVFENKNLKEEKKELIIYLDKNCNR